MDSEIRVTRLLCSIPLKVLAPQNIPDMSSTFETFQLKSPPLKVVTLFDQECLPTPTSTSSSGCRGPASARWPG